ncbi:MAG: InlB B-repeat-containing protein [Anaeroplasmataceae bacterium]
MKKKTIISAVAVAGLASLALASCKKDATYTIELDPVKTGTSGVDTETKYTVKDTAALLEAIKDVKPTKKGYTFAGWYLDQKCTIKLDENTVISDIPDEKDGETDGVRTLFAKWTTNTYTVTYDYKGNAATAGTGKASESVEFGSTVESNVPTTAAKTANGAEMSFVGWYDADGNKWNFAENTVEEDVKLTAKWEIATITNAEEFAAYINSSSTMNAEITADIDMAGVEIKRSLADFTDAEGNVLDGALINSSKTDYQGEFKHKIFGLDHTISNLAITTDLKGGGIWNKFTGGSITDLTFKNCSINTTAANTAFLAGKASGEVSLTDVVFDNVTVTGAATGNGVYATAFATLEADKSVFNGVAVVNANLSLFKYCGGLVGQLSGAGTHEFTDCLVDATITNANQGVGFFVGQLKDGSAATVSFDGCIFKGSINGSGSKNLGGLIGDAKSSTATLSVKDCIATDVEFVGTDTGSDAVDVFFGQNKSSDATTWDNAVYRTYGVTLVGGKSGAKDPSQGVATANADIVAPCDNFVITIDEDSKKLQITLKDTGATETTTDIVGIEANNDPIPVDVQTKSFTGQTGSINDKNEVSFVNVTIPYVQAAEAGKAGYAFLVQANPNTTLVTSTEGWASTGLENATMVNNVLKGYIFFTQEEIDAYNASEENGKYISKEISIRWFLNKNNVANTLTYKLLFKGTISLAANEYEATAVSMVTEGLTAANAENDVKTLNVTAGTIAYDAETQGNKVTVKVAKPSWATATPTVSAGTVTEDADGGALVTFNAKAGDNKFTITWSTAVDSIEYNVNIGSEVVLEADPSTAGQTIVSLDFSTVTAFGDKGTNTEFNSTFTALSSSKTHKVDGEVQRLNLGKGKLTATDNCLQVILTGAAKIEVTVCSSKNTASATANSLIICDTTGTQVSGYDPVALPYSDAEDAKTNVVTFDNVSAGTYIIGGKDAGVYIYSIKVTYLV